MKYFYLFLLGTCACGGSRDKELRTRADADTREERIGDLTRLEAAISSGAQLIITDYYEASLNRSGKFQVSLSEGKYQQCNPVTGPSGCAL